MSCLGYLAKSALNTGYEPKEFDKITSVDDDTMHINDPNRSFSDFSQTTNGNTSQFGVPTELNRRTTIIGRQSEQAQRERIRRHFGSRLSFFFWKSCASHVMFV